MKTPILQRGVALLLAFTPILGAHAVQAGQDAIQNAENAQRQAESTFRTLAALPPACTIGSAKTRRGNWLTSFMLPEPGNPNAFILHFEAAPATGAVRAGLNRVALRALEKVEYRDPAGKWADAGPVTVHEAPAGCDYVWLQHDLGGTHKVEALRYTFRPRTNGLTLASVAVLQ